mgnify:FL=1
MQDYHDKRVYRTRPPFPYAELGDGLVVICCALLALWAAI